VKLRRIAGRLAEAKALVKSLSGHKKVIAPGNPGHYRPPKLTPFGVRLKLFFDRSLLFEKRKNQSVSEELDDYE